MMPTNGLVAKRKYEMPIHIQTSKHPTRELELLNKAKTTKGLKINFAALEKRVKKGDISYDCESEMHHENRTHYRDLYKNTN